jgi:hypothetical protein
VLFLEIGLFAHVEPGCQESLLLLPKLLRAGVVVQYFLEDFLSLVLLDLLDTFDRFPPVVPLKVLVLLPQPQLLVPGLLRKGHLVVRLGPLSQDLLLALLFQAKHSSQHLFSVLVLLLFLLVFEFAVVFCFEV